MTGTPEFAVYDPSTGREVGRVLDHSVEDALAAATAAAGELAAWARADPWQRYVTLKAGVDRLAESVDALADCICAETGKPLSQAVSEAQQTVKFFDWFTHETIRLPSEYWPALPNGRSAFVSNRPVGVVLAITPWNFPAFLVATKVGAALAAGCTVILKPAEQTPLSALFLRQCFVSAGLPSNAWRVVATSDPAPIVAALLSSPYIAALSFTGSPDTGKALMEKASQRVIRSHMELGGNSAAIVLDDIVDPDTVARQIVQSRFRNSGQTCVAINRAYVVKGPSSEGVIAALISGVRGLRTGMPRDSETDIGPLIDSHAVRRMHALVAESAAAGARVVMGDQKLPEPMCGPGANFFRPTLLLHGEGKEPDTCKREVFGPVLSVVTCDSAADAIRRANDTDYGLGAYVFGRDTERAVTIASELAAGSVSINDELLSFPQIPFGGIKMSGLGRERGRRGVEEFLELQTIMLAHSGETP